MGKRNGMLYQKPDEEDSNAITSVYSMIYIFSFSAGDFCLVLQTETDTLVYAFFHKFKFISFIF